VAHAPYRVEHALVVAPLRRRSPPIGLHAHHGHVGGVPHGCADPSGDEARRYLSREGHGALLGVGPLALEHVVEAHTGGGVERLAKHGGGDSGKERGNTL